MINHFLKYKTKHMRQVPAGHAEIENAEKCLFALFTRYGDTIIDLVIIKEFMEKYPNKNYAILCPKQMVPYVLAILPKNIQVLAVNKRNPIDMFKVHLFLKKERFDIGFNPWSNGLDSCFFISYCKFYLCYKKFQKPLVVNHYEVVRQYLLLPAKKWYVEPMRLKEIYRNILICPQSTDSTRSLPQKTLDTYMNVLRRKYPRCHITIASMDPSYFRQDCHSFIFKKSFFSSSEFIKTMQSAELVICADSGPLHIALAFNIDTIGVFSVTKPEIVLNAGARLKIVSINDPEFLEGK